MKIYATLFALTSLSGAAAFTVQSPTKASPLVLRSSSGPASGPENMFPVYPRLDTVQGGETVKTYQMPPWADRAQYFLKTNGRPLKGTVELWVGPIRRTHKLDLDIEDGLLYPYQATLKFRPGPWVIKISTSDSLTLPLMAGMSVPSEERSKELHAITEGVWNSCLPEEKQLIQGGSTVGGGGAVRTYQVPNHVQSVQVVAWSKDTSKKSFRMKIEALQGPNNKRQSMTLQCGGGSQPYHAVLQTQGDGWQIRIKNLKFVEDGLTQVAVVPYEVGDSAPPAWLPSDAANKQWWE